MTEKSFSAHHNHRAQTDNFSKMLEEAFKNWPNKTVVEQDTFTWLPQDELNEICSALFGKSDSYVACTNHTGATNDQLKEKSFPFTGSNTYMLNLYPKSAWHDTGFHEGTHHSISSANQAMAYDAMQKSLECPAYKAEFEENFRKKALFLNYLNTVIDDIDQIEWEAPSPPKIKKHNYEPLIKEILLDYEKEAGKIYKRCKGSR